MFHTALGRVAPAFSKIPLHTLVLDSFVTNCRPNLRVPFVLKAKLN